MERQIAGFGSTRHATELREVFENAAGVLAVNPLIATLCEPYSKATHVIPSGFDAQRFEDHNHRSFDEKPFRILFAGLVEEYMKGFHVLFKACEKLWSSRQDFELHVTADSSSYSAPFLHHRGWQSQQTLPALMADCHVVAVPTVAQEALGRTAVESMGVGRPVIASRIGGLQFTVVDGLTGLLCDPGSSDDLARCCRQLMDDQRLAQQLGEAGRQRFLSLHTWDSVIEKRYRPLFADVGVRPCE